MKSFIMDTKKVVSDLPDDKYGSINLFWIVSCCDVYEISNENGWGSKEDEFG